MAENVHVLQSAAAPVARSHNFFMHWENNVTASSYFTLIEFGWISAFLVQFEHWFHPCAFSSFFAQSSGSVQNQAKWSNFWKNPKISAFSWTQNMHLVRSLPIWESCAKTLRTLSTPPLPSEGQCWHLRATSRWVTFWRMSKISKIHIFQPVAPPVAGMELHWSPSDPQLNFAHFITWVYWDWTRCKNSEGQFPDQRI